jgi:hypothetical protein
MKRVLAATLATLIAGFSFARWCPSRTAAEPSYSPSVRAAFRLKYYPPSGWIQHYLGDDRYKINGKVWKVVSTQLDTYYHRPSCPNMLRQPAGIVIGFASADEAIEGGYRPDPVCRPDVSRVEYTRVQVEIRPQGGENASAGAGVTTINRGRAAQRIMLADGVSTVLLPPNWRRTQSGRGTIAGYSSRGDTLQPLNGRGIVRFDFVTAPGGVNAEPYFLTPTAFTSGLDTLNRQGGATSQVADIRKNAVFSAGRAGGLNGVALKPRPGARIPGLSDRTIVVARDSKIYVIGIGSTAPGAQVALRSFQPR